MIVESINKIFVFKNKLLIIFCNKFYEVSKFELQQINFSQDMPLVNMGNIYLQGFGSLHEIKNTALLKEQIKKGLLTELMSIDN
jgi:hypothetical protein